MKNEALYHSTAEKIKDAVSSQMFGKPCYKIGGKAFCCFFDEEMVFKLNDPAHSDALSLDGTRLFDPSGKGRAMKEWVQVPVYYSDKWDEFALAAANYVGEK